MNAVGAERSVIPRYNGQFSALDLDLSEKERDILPQHKKQIYIVDDDESVCRALKSLLMTFDFEVTTFNSAKVFLETVTKDAPGCLVLDIHMPQMDGWEAQRRVVASGSKRPVIFMSASKDNVADQALKAGAIGFLQKPFDCQTLVDLINR